MSVGPPKSIDKSQPIKPDPSVVAYPIYGYNYQQQYHKDMKVCQLFHYIMTSTTNNEILYSKSTHS